ncbi:manganese catalase family protein [Methylocella tundrae]|jgi:Mn-containing catalase|uniref:manganese catalase family protein n=1 Tax=Methylocella tundrae TaxID=227605 RepID=UPI0030FF2347|nr:manganese catalase family protein [Methylocella tundrae]
MFLHKTLPIHEVRVENPDPVFAEKLLEQYGGATGELSAALTYLTQSYHTDDPAIRDMLQDIGTEELGHLEMIALLIEQHTKRASGDLQDKAYQSTLFAIRGPGPHLVDSKGTTWDSRYVSEGGHVVRDLRANISAEAGALNTYEQLIAMATDDGTRAALRHLATREVSHTHMFMEALNSLNALDKPLFGDLKPDETVNLYFNLSSGPGGDERGPWNREPTFQYVAEPLHEAEQQQRGASSSRSSRSK